MKIAYAFALVGTDLHTQHAITHLTAIHLFLMTKPRFNVISVQTENMKSLDKLQTNLKNLSVKPVFVEPIVSPHCQNIKNFRFAFSYTILNVWNLTQYDKILYMDTDLIVLKNLDQQILHWATLGTIELRTPIGCSYMPGRSDYNTGVWGITPSVEIFEKLYKWLEKPRYACGIGFQTAANKFGINHNFTALSLEFNLKADQGVTKCTKRYSLPYVGIVHWSGKNKPVGRTTNDQMEQNPLKMYQSMHAFVTQKYNK
jgi:hypothetical protein